jgi:N,N'-diacetylchitobiose transport system permease protein
VNEAFHAGGPTALAAEAEIPARLPVAVRPLRSRIASRATPYALLAPTVAVLAVVLAYPLYQLVRISLEKFGLRELIAHKGTWAGLANYSEILHDAEFWRVVARTAIFAAVNVSLTMVLGTLVALLLERLARPMQLLVTTALISAWAMPFIVAVDIWQWMVDFEFGVGNWTLTHLGFGNFVHHNWFASPWQGFAVITACVVWGAIPFVAITVYAALTQVPRELVEAAQVDGASGWVVFRNVTMPLLKPIFIILTSLSIIWDFQVFNQVFVMLGERPTSDYYLLSIYSFVRSFRVQQYGSGAAIAIVMVFLMLGVSFVYVRQMVRISEDE